MDEVADEAAWEVAILDQLSRERLDEGRRIMAGLESEQADVAGRVHALFDAGRREEGIRLSDQWELDDLLVRLSAEQQRCLLFAAAERMMVQEYGLPTDCFDWLKYMPLDLAVGDVRLLAAAGNPRAATASECYRPFGLVLRLTRQLLAAEAAGATALPAFLAEMAAGWNAMTWDWPDQRYQHKVAGLRDEAFELAGLAPALPATEGAVGRDDGYGLAVIGWLGVIEDWPEGLAELLAHCATAESARPSARWENACRQRLDGLSDATRIIRGLLELAVSAPSVSFLSDFGQRSVLLGYNEQMLRGVVWAAGLLDEEWVPDLLRAVAVRCLRLCSGHVFRPTAVPGEKVPHACIRSLARSGTDASVIALAKIGRATSHRGVLKQLGKLLAEVSARRGMSAASMMELLTPDHGLDAGGQVVVTTDAGDWTIRLDDHYGATLTAAEGPVPEDAAELLSEIRGTVSIARERIEGLFTARREWHVEDFLACYVRHRLTGWLARRLAWTFSSGDGQAIHGFPDPTGTIIQTTEGACPVPAGSLVRLLHPVTVTAAELDQLRQLAARLDIIQPVRQLWRETYRLNTAEHSSGLYTDRYAGYVVRFKQFYGLARRRGWAGGFLSGAWDGGDSAIARRDYPAAGLRASWALEQLEGLSTEVAVDLCITGRLVFSPLDDAVRTPVTLADVPVEIFSEAMRDLDLLVSVTTVANDPIWLEKVRGAPGMAGYWERVAGAGLDQLRVHRHEVLTSFYGGQARGDRIELTRRDLIVRGSLATYRIDLATANVRMEPAGKWLSFDTRLTADDTWQQQILGLPAMDDDEILQRILIRAAILADDDKVASRKLLKQIRG